MRFPVAAIFCVILLFIAFVGYAVTSFLLSTTEDTLTPAADQLSDYSKNKFLNLLETINLGFGVAMVFFFILIIVVFVVDSLRQEPETFQPPGGYY